MVGCTDDLVFDDDIVKQEIIYGLKGSNHIRTTGIEVFDFIRLTLIGLGFIIEKAITIGGVSDYEYSLASPSLSMLCSNRLVSPLDLCKIQADFN
ncbi:MAG: hypothetical protein PHT39_02185 [Sphaerochaetaceae bacterium]|nr:hypothetical protein [Sphaerochaetaceae bacterium]MDD3162853.1 hypothetical protein [Sphaerochaetaceae bacterium]MDD4396365.1 hypothetical protein [Sphaerochaetaceae bacterium]